MKRVRTLLFLAVLGGLSVGQVWAHGGGPELTRGPGGGSEQNATESKHRQLERLQEKMDKIDQQLEDPKLSAKKRAKLEKKLKKLLAKKEKLLAGN